jgi:DNA-binding transcriptional LysR family regulator
MNLADMHALVAVVESGSLAHAAVRLSITQPAITRRIQRLEEALGAKLLDRDVKPARPTAEGEAAYAECIRVLNAADGLKSALAREPRLARTLRIGVSLGAADIVLPVLLPAPQAAGTVAVETGRSISLEGSAAEGRIDAAFVFRQVGREFDSGEKLANLPVRVVAPASMQLPRRVALKDLRGRRWVLCPDDCGYRRALEHRLYGAAQSLDVAAAIWGFGIQARLVATGVGLGLLPEQVIAESPDADRLQVLEVADFRAALDLWLVRSSSAVAADPRLDALADKIRGHLDGQLAMAS